MFAAPTWGIWPSLTFDTVVTPVTVTWELPTLTILAKVCVDCAVVIPVFVNAKILPILRFPGNLSEILVTVLIPLVRILSVTWACPKTKEFFWIVSARKVRPTPTTPGPTDTDGPP